MWSYVGESKFELVYYLKTSYIRYRDLTNQSYLRLRECIPLFILYDHLNETTQKDDDIKILEVGATMKHWNFVTKKVPVESFVGSSTGTSC